jgi:beta-glucanase (GH16 family)
MAIFDAVQPPQMTCPGFESDCATGVTISATGDGKRRLRVTSVRAAVPPPPTLPDWLGKRPPVPGDWLQTLAEDFDGPELDSTKWSPDFPNLWGKGMRFSKDNVILGDGTLRLRFERERGHVADDPAQPETEWVTGMITSQGRWRQRYGYFEARLKLPRAPGMWHGWFLLPDRGPEPERILASTTDGGMELDIMEYFTRYGPYRYNVGCLWDGYLEDGKCLACPRIYVRPDADGFFTSGLLWEPGRVTFYTNGAPVAQWTDPRIGSVPAYVLVTAHTNSIGGNTLTGEGLPDDFVLDYVRAWQRRDWVEAKGQ